MRYSKKEGFTLIELLVVIAIIGLLSSIVMAALSDARNKAKSKAFRADVVQLINALEIYRNQNGIYPEENTYDIGSGQSYTFVMRNNNTQLTPSVFANLAPIVVSVVPKLPDPKGSGTGTAWTYRTNAGTPAKIRCVGDNGIPKYIFYVSDSTLVQGFSDWPAVQVSSDSGATWTSTIPNTACFSLK